MADIKFTCTNCSQHISCDEAWAGHPIACPACQTNIIVPAAQPVFNPRIKSVHDEPETPVAAKLARGATKVVRSNAHAPSIERKFIPRRRAGDNPLVKFAVLLVVIGLVGGLFYFFGLPLLSSLKEAVPSTPAANSSSGGGRGGPLGEMNEAMDVSDALDSGSSSRPKARQAPATNSTAAPRGR